MTQARIEHRSWQEMGDVSPAKAAVMLASRGKYRWLFSRNSITVEARDDDGVVRSYIVERTVHYKAFESEVSNAD